MKIPDKITLMGREIDIVYDKKLVQDEDAIGQVSYRTDKIILQPETESIDRNSQSIQITFLHELLHFMLNILNYQNMNDNGKFINRMSELLYQVIKQIEDKNHGKK